MGFSIFPLLSMKNSRKIYFSTCPFRPDYQEKYECYLKNNQEDDQEPPPENDTDPLLFHYAKPMLNRPLTGSLSEHLYFTGTYIQYG
jgi:hypothetical protein